LSNFVSLKGAGRMADMGTSSTMGSSTMGEASPTGANAKEKIAGGLERAADRLRQNVESMEPGARGRAALVRVASGVQSTADYVRGVDVANLGDEARTYIREKPQNALVAAAIGGFLLGLLLSRR
jgi:ElaB/YqjD/DUF883 family membrane-anchored ribosome-binding protein